MQITIDYSKSIYREHLMEASCLYDQRNILLNDPAFDWPELKRFEDRFEAHIDALKRGREEVLEWCGAACLRGDAGELHAALRVFCRKQRLDLIQSVLDGLDPQNQEALDAAGSALAADMPGEHAVKWLRSLMTDHAPLVSIAANVITGRRLDMGHELSPFLKNGDDAAMLKTLLRATGRIPASGKTRGKVLPDLYGMLERDDPEICREAARALLRLGETRALDICRAHAKKGGRRLLLPIGLGGDKNDVPLLLDMAASSRPTPDGLTALGLLGDSRAVPALLAKLENQELAPAAAQALWLVTGADLYEQIFIPAKFALNELFDDELEQYKKGEFTPPPNMRGSTVTRISQNQADWRAWHAQNSGRFDPSVRYRRGKPYDPVVSPALLAHPKTCRGIRELLVDELAIRHGIDVPLETDMFVAVQQKALNEIAFQIKM